MTDEEMKNKTMSAMQMMGVKEDMMSDEMIEGVHQSMMGAGMMMKAMMTKGMSKDETMAMMKKFSDMMMTPEAMKMVDEMTEMEWK